MIVYLCRHASAGRRHADARQDQRRRLDGRGQRQARQLGAVLAALGVRADAILTSPLPRAAQTAALLAAELGHRGALQMEAGLNPQADFAAFRELLERYSGCEAVIAVGHKPSLPACLSRMLGAPRAAVELKKGAAAKLDTAGGRARLCWLLTPAVIASLYSKTTANSKPKTARK